MKPSHPLGSTPAGQMALTLVADPALFGAPASAREIAWRALHSERGLSVAPLRGTRRPDRSARP